MKTETKKLIDRINEMGLMIQPAQLHSAILERVQAVDNQIGTLLLALVEFDRPEDNVHETGVSFGRSLDLLEDRRKRLLGYIESAGLTNDDYEPDSSDD